METAKRAKAFGASVDVIRRSPATSEIVDRSGTMVDLPKFLPDADVIVLACALNDDTRKFASVDFFGAIKEGAILINIARGNIVEEAALIEALQAGTIGGAGLDVYEFEPEVPQALRDLDNVVLLPHLGTSSREVRVDMWMMAVENLKAGVAGETPPNLV